MFVSDKNGPGSQEVAGNRVGIHAFAIPVYETARYLVDRFAPSYGMQPWTRSISWR
jgi:hypothetical protein